MLMWQHVLMWQHLLMWQHEVVTLAPSNALQVQKMATTALPQGELSHSARARKIPESTGVTSLFSGAWDNGDDDDLPARGSSPELLLAGVVVVVVVVVVWLVRLRLRLFYSLLGG
jgi:hypothetical protein